MKTIQKIIALSAIFCLLIFLFYFFKLSDYFSLDYFKEHQAYLSCIIRHHYFLMLFIYFILHTLMILFMLPLTLVLTIVAGFFFGAWQTIITTVIGSVIASGIFFLIVRSFNKKWFSKKIDGTVVETFTKKFNKHGANYILSLHFLPLTPFALINTMAALSNVPFTTFLWTTAIGVLPTTTLSALAGQQLATIETPQQIFTPFNTVLLIIFTLTALFPVIINYKKR